MSTKTENEMGAYLYSMRIIKLRRNLLSALGMILLWALGRSPYKESLLQGEEVGVGRGTFCGAPA